MSKRPLVLSIVVPVYNEGGGIESFHRALTTVLDGIAKDSYEVIYCDDGSQDNTAEVVRKLRDDEHIKLIKFSRNFGKESALTAGIAEARGEAIITLDGDSQHPVELLPRFVDLWRAGAQVVIGVRVANSGEGFVKRYGSRWFYGLFNKVTGQKLIPGSGDFRLIDRVVQEAFLSLKETDRVTRGLIDWLGFRREYVRFKANAREVGTASYSLGKLARLAANSFVSLTPQPLYISGYLGIFIMFGAFVLGLAVIVEQLILGDPLSWNFTGTAMLGIMLLFLVGILLVSQGILALYVSHIHSQAKGRPLYIIDRAGSVGLQGEAHLAKTR
ncbi:MAG TPA: glycosyltransferase family 2 protein [Candidatus Saccharimonadales bacterium]|nr:glycosyltransferase family 2 protein [Candidatus Saccharimonadales bacterium]